MRTLSYRYYFKAGHFMHLLLTMVIILVTLDLSAQEPPPRPVGVTLVQNLSFGAFSHGFAGGTVTIEPAGTRTATGDIILLTLGYSFTPATFRLVANPGTVVSVLNGSDISLAGSNGGSMLLHLGSTDPVSPMVITTIPPDYTLLSIGGTLTVGNSAANPPGAYSGLFIITLIQE
jgi:hypothetical protein